MPAAKLVTRYQEMPEANHPIWKVLQGVVIASVLIFALSPYSGLYNSWTKSDILTVLAVLASWAGFQLPVGNRNNKHE